MWRAYDIIKQPILPISAEYDVHYAFKMLHSKLMNEEVEIIQEKTFVYDQVDGFCYS